MKRKKDINFFHIIIQSFAIYFIAVGCAFLFSLVKTDGVIINYQYRIAPYPLSSDEFEKLQGATLFSGFGVVIGVAVSFIWSLLINRKNNFHWINSLVAVILMFAIGVGIKAADAHPQSLLLAITIELKIAAVSASILIGGILISIGSFIFLAKKLQNIRPFQKSKVEDDLMFQFEKQNEPSKSR